MKFRGQSYQFKPRWSFFLLTVVMVTLFINLGCWQLSRAQQKRTWMTLYQNRLKAPPVPLEQLPPSSDRRFYPVLLKGHYDNPHTFLLDNRIYHHQVGYEVLTPFITPHKIVLVNRGWIPASPDRQQLPVIPVNNSQTIQGIVFMPDKKPFMLGNAVAQNSWPMRLEGFDPAAIHTVLNQPVEPYMIWLTQGPTQGMIRDWHPVSSPPEKHTGYAVQWFTFAAVMIIIFILLSFQKTKTGSYP
ncbi:MAG: SURF1 family protein [Gammaproteobacteria bacterium]